MSVCTARHHMKEGEMDTSCTLERRSISGSFFFWEGGSSNFSIWLRHWSFYTSFKTKEVHSYTELSLADMFQSLRIYFIKSTVMGKINVLNRDLVRRKSF